MITSDLGYCKFCLSNGEAEALFRSHVLKDERGLVVCPILSSHVCGICGATGGYAHTIRYCPLNKDGKLNHGASLAELKRRKNAAGNYPMRKCLSSPTSRIVMEQQQEHIAFTDPVPYAYRKFIAQDAASRRPVHQRIHGRPIHEEELRSSLLKLNEVMANSPQYAEIVNHDRRMQYGVHPLDYPQYSRRFPSFFGERELATISNAKGHNEVLNGMIDAKDVFRLLKNAEMMKPNCVPRRYGNSQDDLGVMLADLREGTVEIAMQ